MDNQYSSANKSNRLLKATDVAKHLSISRSKAYQLMLRGDIPTVRFDGSVRVRERDLEEFVQRSWTGWKQD